MSPPGEENCSMALPDVGKDVTWLRCSYTDSGSTTWESATSENNWILPRNLHIPYAQVSSLLCRYTRQTLAPVYQEICAWKFRAEVCSRKKERQGGREGGGRKKRKKGRERQREKGGRKTARKEGDGRKEGREIKGEKSSPPNSLQQPYLLN